MSVHSIFKKLVNESVFAKGGDETDIPDINESIDDGPQGSLTRNNIIPSLFHGQYHGLRVPAAVRKGNAVPYWGRKYLIYPFVGIYGCSDKPAISASHGHEVSFIRGKLEQEERHPSVQSILDRQVSQGTGIPEDVFIMFPKTAISSVGKVGNRKSESLFNIYRINDAYSMSIYPYNVQQALSVGGDGRVYPDPNKAGGTVLLPSARSEQMRSGGLLVLDKLRKEDLVALLELNGDMTHKRFAREFTGDLTLQTPGGSMLGSYMSGVAAVGGSMNPTFANRIKSGGNPTFGRFDEFAKKNEFIADDGSIDFMAVRDWILGSDGIEIVDELIIPYLLPAPFDKIYCWREVTPSMRSSLDAEIKLIEALTGGSKGRSGLDADGEEVIEVEPDDGSVGAVAASAEVDVGESSDEAPVFGRNVDSIDESSGDISGISSRGTINMSGYMRIFDRAANYHHETMKVMVRQRMQPLVRGDGTTTEGTDVKRTFVRVIFDNTELTETDEKYCPKDADGIIRSASGTLDYSQIFEEYGNILDNSAPKVFKCKRLVGYIVSFKYDPELEAERERSRRAGLFNYYLKNSKMLNEPTVFDVLYVFNGDGDGNFIFTGYANRKENVHTYVPDVPPPTSIDDNHLYAGSTEGLHSVIVHDMGRVQVPYSFNQKAF